MSNVHVYNIRYCHCEVTRISDLIFLNKRLCSIQQLFGSRPMRFCTTSVQMVLTKKTNKRRRLSFFFSPGLMFLIVSLILTGLFFTGLVLLVSGSWKSFLGRWTRVFHCHIRRTFSVNASVSRSFIQCITAGSNALLAPNSNNAQGRI